MYRKIWGVVAFILTLVVAATNAAGSAPTAANVTLTPLPLALTAGSSADVTVRVSGAQNLGAFEFVLTYNPAVVRPTSVSLDSMLTSSATYTASLLGPKIDPVAGTIRFAAYTLGTGAGPNGTGNLARVRFEGVAPGESSLVFSKIRLTDRVAVLDAAATAVNGRVVVNGSRVLLPVLRKN